MPPGARPHAQQVLVVDDDRSIHQDYERCLGPIDPTVTELSALRAGLFGAPRCGTDDERRFPLVHADSGEAAYAAVEKGLASGRRFPVAFVDMRMSPGWSGIETIVQMWGLDPDIEVVVCTAYSDFTWSEVLAAVKGSGRIHLLRKPFDGVHVRRFAGVLVHKWELVHRKTCPIATENTG